ncbi:ANTAR domain-containing protein [Streptomyces sp. M19]
MFLGPDADPELYGGTDHRDAVHQAAGMLSVQANCSVGDALAIIRARAFAEEVSTDAIAGQVMRGELKLT